MAAMPREECARRLGDSPSKRMSASWSRFRVNLTEYKVAVRHSTPKGELPPEYCQHDRETTALDPAARDQLSNPGS